VDGHEEEENVTVLEGLKATQLHCNGAKHRHRNQLQRLDYTSVAIVGGLDWCSFAPVTTLKYQKSAVNSTEKNQLSHGSHHFCCSNNIYYALTSTF
jgi:hypothetical protein